MKESHAVWSEAQKKITWDGIETDVAANTVERYDFVLCPRGRDLANMFLEHHDIKVSRDSRDEELNGKALPAPC